MISLHIFHPSEEIIYGSPHIPFKTLNEPCPSYKFTYKSFKNFLVGIRHPNLDEFIIKRKIDELVDTAIFEYIFSDFLKFCTEIERNFFHLIKLNSKVKTNNYQEKDKLYIDIHEEISCIIDEHNKIDYYFGKGEIKIKPFFKKPKSLNIAYNLNDKTVFDFTNRNSDLIGESSDTIIFQKYTFSKKRVPLLILKIEKCKYLLKVDVLCKELKISFPFGNYKYIEIPSGVLKYSEDGIDWILKDVKGEYNFNIQYNNTVQDNINDIFTENKSMKVTFTCEQTSLSGLQLSKVDVDDVLIKHTATSTCFEIRKNIFFPKVFDKTI